MLKNTEASYTAHAGEGAGWVLWDFSLVQQPVMIKETNPVTLNQCIISLATQQCSCKEWSLGQHLPLTAQGSPPVIFIMQKDLEITSCDNTDSSQLLFDERLK